MPGIGVMSVILVALATTTEKKGPCFDPKNETRGMTGVLVVETGVVNAQLSRDSIGQNP